MVEQKSAAVQPRHKSHMDYPGIKKPGLPGKKLATELHGRNTRKVNTSTKFTDQLEYVLTY